MSDLTATPYYVWRVPDKGVSVHLSLSVIDHVGMAVAEGVRALPRRGLEIGGLLLGRTRRERNAIVVEVFDSEPIACEHALGPSYLLAGTDRSALEERLRSHKSSNHLDIVGAYRSHTRKDFALTPEDADFMAAYFADPSQVFLLIHASREIAATAGFAIWESRKIQSIPYCAFPFRSSDLIAGKYEICAGEIALAAPPNRTEILPAAVPSKLPDAPLVLRAASSEPMTVTKEIGALLLFKKLRSALGNRALVPISAVRFKAAWLASLSGLLVACLAMTLQHRSAPATGLAPRSLSTVHDEKLSEPIRDRQATSVQAGVAQETKPAQAAASANADLTRIRVQATANKKTAHRAAPPRSFPNPMPVPAVPRAGSYPQIPSLPEPPQIEAKLTWDAEFSSKCCEIPALVAPSIPAPFVNVTLDALEPNRPGVLSKLPVFGKRHKQNGFVPPVALLEAPTEVSMELRDQLTREVPIDVRLYVDRTGKVEFAELLSDGTGSNRDLAAAAVFSSRHWLFSPALSGGQAVSAKVILRFRFGYNQSASNGSK